MTLENFIDLNGQRVYTKIIGDGEPIVFLHGGPGSEHGFFLPHVLPMAQGFKLVLYDQRGCGKSERSDQYSMEEEVETLELLRTELGLDKISLFGESWGSMLALLYATRHPELINKIFLTAAIGITSEGFKKFKGNLFRRLSLRDKFRLFRVDRALRKGNKNFESVLHILDPYYVFGRDAD
ncbi:alpha/beta fold hydrolase [Alicyclobacillus sp. SO9]|uniref:alpha/beta fold hydrolase n=1 Tax=Alicyclobacillus sp. SO9 TaxID=2665646 RepID=UPI0018E8EEAA|nr:alpha/beta fold hydrolase [Alicyclobacillus sp. SO9]